MRQLLCAVFGGAIAMSAMVGVANWCVGLYVVDGVFGGAAAGLVICTIVAALLGGGTGTNVSRTNSAWFAFGSTILLLCIYAAFFVVGKNSGSLIELAATVAMGAVTGLAAAQSAKLAG